MSYVAGSVRYHSEGANLHRRQKKTATKQLAVAGGLTAAGLGGAHAANTHSVRAAHYLAPKVMFGGRRPDVKAELAGKLRVRGVRGGLITAGVGAAGLGAAAASRVHHAHAENSETRSAQKARAQKMADRSARTSDVAKLGPPKVRFQEVTGHSQRGNTTTTHNADTVHTRYEGKSAVLRRKKYQAHAHPRKFKPKAGDVLEVSPNVRVRHPFNHALADAHEQKAKHVDLAGTRFKHVSKSAFGVAHTEIDKGLVARVFKPVGAVANKGLARATSGPRGKAVNDAVRYKVGDHAMRGVIASGKAQTKTMEFLHAQAFPKVTKETKAAAKAADAARYARPAPRDLTKPALAAAGVGTATAAGGYALGQQKKSTVTKSGAAMTVSAFGVEHTGIAKAETTSPPNAKPSGGRQATGSYFGYLHSAVAGKKGHKLRAVGSSIGHNAVGYTAGALTGAGVGHLAGGAKGARIGAQLGAVAGGVGGNHRAVITNSRKGRYKTEHLNKSAFGVVHPGDVSKLDVGAAKTAIADGAKALRKNPLDAAKGLLGGAKGTVSAAPSEGGQLGADLGQAARKKRGALIPLGVGVSAGGAAGYAARGNN